MIAIDEIHQAQAHAAGGGWLGCFLLVRIVGQAIASKRPRLAVLTYLFGSLAMANMGVVIVLQIIEDQESCEEAGCQK